MGLHTIVRDSPRFSACKVIFVEVYINGPALILAHSLKEAIGPWVIIENIFINYLSEIEKPPLGFTSQGVLA